MVHVSTGRERQKRPNAWQRQSGSWPRRADDPWTPDRVRALRAHARLTQADLATIMRVHPMSVWCWEHGKRDPNVFSCRLLDMVAKRQKFALATITGNG